MDNNSNDRSVKLLGGLTLVVLTAIGIVYTMMGAPRRAGGRSFAVQAQESHPTRLAPPARPADRPAPQIYQPAELAQLLSSASKPTVVSVSTRALYDSGHISGALFHGPASTRDGLKDLRQWAEGVDKTTEIVLYCGCCPMEESPNVRPALKAMRDMGFTHVHVLWLEHDFQTNWADKGYPVEKGK
jgi:rhodanese-related sulfurtransferase